VPASVAARAVVQRWADAVDIDRWRYVRVWQQETAGGCFPYTTYWHQWIVLQTYDDRSIVFPVKTSRFTPRIALLSKAQCNEVCHL